MSEREPQNTENSRQSRRKGGLGNTLRAAAVALSAVAGPVASTGGMVAAPTTAEARVGPVDQATVEKVHALLARLEQGTNSKWSQVLGFKIRIDKPKNMMSGGKITVFKEGSMEEVASLEYHQLLGVETQLGELKSSDVAAEILLQANRLRKNEFVTKGQTIETQVSISAYAQALMTLGGASYNQEALRTQLGSIPFTGENTQNRNRKVEIVGMVGLDEPTVLACVFTTENKLEAYHVILGNQHNLQQLSADEAYKKCK